MESQRCRRGCGPPRFTSLYAGFKNKKAENSKFLGQKDQTYDRQTTARIIKKFKEAGLGNKLSQNRQNNIVKPQKQVKQKNITKKIVKKKNIGQRGKRITLADLSPKKKVIDLKKIKTRPPQIAQGLRNGNKAMVGLARNNDFLDDLPLGDMTNLNTTEFK